MDTKQVVFEVRARVEGKGAGSILYEIYQKYSKIAQAQEDKYLKIAQARWLAAQDTGSDQSIECTPTTIRYSRDWEDAR